MNYKYPMRFTGTETGFLDDHGRLVLPQVWRDAFAECKIAIILLSDGRDEHRLVVYPCPSGVPGTSRPAHTPDWGDLPPRGEFVHAVDAKGRFCTPAQFHKHCQGKQILLKGCQDHFVVTPHDRLLNSSLSACTVQNDRL